MVINITTCMMYLERSYSSDRGRCKHLVRGGFGGFVCKLGNQIEFVSPRISKDVETCKDKEVLRSA
jgi:hypothetical protein